MSATASDRSVADEALPRSYSPHEAEPLVRAAWARHADFHADPDGSGDAYCVLIPPPNVTAALHLGHAFNNTLQDILIRFHRICLLLFSIIYLLKPIEAY